MLEMEHLVVSIYYIIYKIVVYKIVYNHTFIIAYSRSP